MRLQKFMAQAGVSSRRKCEEIITAGRVKVNGIVAGLGSSIDPQADEVFMDDKKLQLVEERVVIALNKPKGVITSASDPEGRPTVMKYFVGLPYRIYNIGRLDIDSEGLLLLTNDGELAHKMTHPRFMVKKTYYVVCDGDLTQSERESLENGVELEEGITAPALVSNVRVQQRSGATAFQMTIREGRNRQIRRMLMAVGHKTLLLRRLKMGPISLDGLPIGEWRFLTADELNKLDALI